MNGQSLEQGSTTAFENLRSWVNSHRRLVALIALSILACLCWALIPWQWSTIDDPGHVIDLQTRIQEHGTIPGIIDKAWADFTADFNIGRFRPAYALYSSLFYLLPTQIAHAVRLLFFLVAIVGPLAYLRRRRTDWWTITFAGLLLLIGSKVLIDGLFFLSLQELSGAAFIGLGFLVRSPRWRVAFWIVAALFKSPFAFLVIASSVEYWRRGRKVLALVGAGMGVGTLFLEFWLSRTGYYTAGRMKVSPASLIETLIHGNGPKLVEAPTWIILIAFTWWVLIARAKIRLDYIVACSAFGLLGYTAIMLPWSLSGYYLGPILYLFALTLILSLRGKVVRRPWQLAIGLLLPVILTVLTLGSAISRGLSSNAAIVGASNCLASIQGKRTIASSGRSPYLDTPEASQRFSELALMRDPAWQGELIYAPPGDQLSGSNPDYFLWLGPQPLVPKGYIDYCSAGDAHLYIRT